MKNNKKKVWFIVLVSIFGVLWVASLVFLGLSSLSEAATNSIESAYSSVFNDKTLDLHKVCMYTTIIYTVALLITLLSKEIKVRYSK